MKPILTDFGKEWDEVILRCSCGDDHFLVLQVDDWREEELEEPWMVSASIIDEYRTPDGFWDFLKAVWQLFRKGRYCRSGALLSRDDLKTICNWCQETLLRTEEA